RGAQGASPDDERAAEDALVPARVETSVGEPHGSLEELGPDPPVAIGCHRAALTRAGAGAAPPAEGRGGGRLLRQRHDRAAREASGAAQAAKDSRRPARGE